MRVGTRIVFPDLRLSLGGYKDVDLTVTSGSKSVFSNVWCRSDEETYDRHIFTQEWGGYDTLTGVPRGRISPVPDLLEQVAHLVLERGADDQRLRSQRIRLGGLRVAEAEVRGAPGVQDRAHDPRELSLLG